VQREREAQEMASLQMALAGELVRQESVLREQGLSQKDIDRVHELSPWHDGNLLKAAESYTQMKQSLISEYLDGKQVVEPGVGPLPGTSISEQPNEIAISTTPSRRAGAARERRHHRPPVTPAIRRAVSRNRQSLPQGSSTSMGGATLSTLSNVMKNLYLGPVQVQFNNEILVNQLLELSDENLVGLKAIVPLHSKRSGGIGSRGELETLPAAGNQGYDQANFDLAYHYGRAQVSGQAIHKTSSSAGAFLQAMKSEIDGLRDDLALDFARQVYGTGDGVVASLAANTAQTTINLGSSEAIIKGFLYINMVIDIGDTSNPQSVAAARVITDVDPTANAGTAVTISGAAVTTTTSHRIFRRATRARAPRTRSARWTRVSRS
jgi:hypothetical protein